MIRKNAIHLLIKLTPQITEGRVNRDENINCFLLSTSCSWWNLDVVSQLQKRLERLGHSVDILSHNIDATELLAENRNFPFHKSFLYYAKQKRKLPQHSNRCIDKTEEYRYSLESSSLSNKISFMHKM